MHWRRATFPTAPLDEITLELVEEAYLTRVTRGPLRTVERPERWHRGAVYDARGSLVVASQKIGGTNAYPWVAADPESVKVRQETERLEGEWLYAGHWFQHFGHFFLETLTTLWPRGLDVDGLVFHVYSGHPFSVEPWQSRLLELAGFGGLPVRVVAKRPLRVERLHVPSRSAVAHGWAHREAWEVWDRIASPFRSGGPARVYLSRTQFNEGVRRQGGKSTRTEAEQDQAYDRVFTDLGFHVAALETLEIDEQLRMLGSARVVAGLQGSALHLAACAPRGARVLEIGDTRIPTRPSHTQCLINAVCGHSEAFLRGDLPLDEIPHAVAELDVSP